LVLFFKKEQHFFFEKKKQKTFANLGVHRMSRIAYVDGRYVPLAKAHVHVEDRGFQFADGVYEVLYRHQGRLIDRDLHLDRLDRSLRELQLTPPMGRAALLAVVEEVARRNRLESGLIYLQVTRGSAPRLHAFPPAGTPPTLVVTMRRAPPFPRDVAAWQAAAITLPDQRWARCDIKSVGLLPNVLAREAARAQGALEAILVDDDGMVTEGASTTVFMVDASGQVRTRPLSNAILPGCTRSALIARMAEAGLAVEERAFSADEMRGAREIFITAATTFVKPITVLDGRAVGDGVPGPVASRLFALIAQHVTGMRNAG
jgi:D-alanine transaminase